MASIREQTRRRPRLCCPGDVVYLVYAAARSSGHGEGFGQLPNPAAMKASSDPDILKFMSEVKALGGGGAPVVGEA